MKGKYPARLFWIGLFMNLTKNFFLLIPAVILLVVGIWVRMCLLIGLALLILDFAVSLIEQIQIRNVTLNSDNPNFKEWQDAILSPEWQENIMNLMESKIGDDEKVDPDDPDDSDDPPS